MELHAEPEDEPAQSRVELSVRPSASNRSSTRCLSSVDSPQLWSSKAEISAGLHPRAALVSCSTNCSVRIIDTTQQTGMRSLHRALSQRAKTPIGSSGKRGPFQDASTLVDNYARQWNSLTSLHKRGANSTGITGMPYPEKKTRRRLSPGRCTAKALSVANSAR